MSKQDIDRHSKNRRQRDWREICEEVLKEKNSDRVDELLNELLDALEKRPRPRAPGHRIDSIPSHQKPRFGAYFAKLGIV